MHLVDQPANTSAGQIKLLERSCPICESTNDSATPNKYSRDGWCIIDCKSCGFTYLPKVPESSELEVNLAWEKSTVSETARRRRRHPVQQWVDAKTRWRLHLLPRLEGVDILNKQAKPGPAIDLGCGAGAWLQRFAAKFTPHGVEISKHLAAAAQSSVSDRGGRVINASTADGLKEFPDGFFTAALARSYLEHDWRAREVLQLLFRKLTPGGLVAVKVPNYGSLNRRVMGNRWCGFRLPDHVNYFDKKSVRRLATDIGFGVSIPLVTSLPTDDNLVAMLTKPES